MSEHEEYVATMTSHGFHEYMHLFESINDVKLFRRTAKRWTLEDVTCGSSSDVQKKRKKIELAYIVVSNLHEEYREFREVVLTLIMNYRSTGFAVPFIRRQVTRDFVRQRDPQIVAILRSYAESGRALTIVELLLLQEFTMKLGFMIVNTKSERDTFRSLLHQLQNLPEM